MKSNILVVDDEPSILMFAERVLRAAGYAIDRAADGPAALSVAARFSGIGAS